MEIERVVSVFNNKIIIFDETLVKDECQQLIKLYQTFGPTHEWNGTFPMKITNQNDVLKEKVNKIKSNISSFFELEIDWCEIVKWPIGSHQDNHFDVVSEETIFTSVTYLNDNFSGGETCFVNDIKVIPKVGRTVFFNGVFYEHGVSEVKENIRYTLPIWYKIKK